MREVPPMRGRYRAYSLVCLTGTLGFGMLFALPPLVPFIQRDLSLTYTQTGLLLAVPFFMMIVTPVPGGWLGDRIGNLRVIGLASILLSAGAFLRGLAPTLPLLLLCSVVFGVGLGLTWPNSPKVIYRWFPSSRVATLLGLLNVGFMVVAGVIQSFTLGVVFPLAGGWRGALMIWGGVMGIAAALWWAGYPRKEPALGQNYPSSASVERDPAARLALALKNRNLWLIACLYLVLDVQFYGITGWMPTYLQEAGVLAETSGTMTAAFFWAAVPVVAILALWSDRAGLRKPFIWAPALVNLAASLAFISWPTESSWILLAVMGAALVGPFMLLIAIVMEVFHPAVTGTALGIIISVGYIGAVSGPYLMGYLRETGGTFFWSWLLIVAAAAVYAALPFLLTETGHKVRARAL